MAEPRSVIAPPAPDKIDAAIAGSEPETQLVQLRVRLGSGRPILIAVPVDFSAAEALDLIGYIVRGLPDQLAQMNAAASAAPKILVPDRPQLVRP